MRVHYFIPAVFCLMLACSKDEEIIDSGQVVGIAPPSTPEFNVEDILGSYYGRYAFGGGTPIPPPGSYYSFLDTMVVIARPDTTDPIDPNYIYIGNESFTLHEDGTLGSHMLWSTFSGSFQWDGDTLRLMWDRYWHGHYSDYSYSNFDGFKQ